jgi:glycerol-3-phosphate dehydrogenase (NAD(P)+)
MIGVVGAGAFGTALAIAMGHGGSAVRLWARDANSVAQMQATGRSTPPLAGINLPQTVSVHAELSDLAPAEIVLLCVPTQSLRGFLMQYRPILNRLPLVACCKGVDLTTLTGPTAQIAAFCPDSVAAILTGPSFAADIAAGLPTALTLACADDAAGKKLQTLLSAPNLRLYRNQDVIGAELGGAIKNVIAIACGAAIGLGMGESARAALMTRGFAEMQRLARVLGAKSETLMGLSGFGDLVLTCTSAQSRNYRYGLALGQGTTFDMATTVEGVATAQATARLAQDRNLDMPITTMLAAITRGDVGVAQAMQQLFTRPLKPE